MPVPRAALDLAAISCGERRASLVKGNELVIRVCTWNVAEVRPETVCLEQLRRWVLLSDAEAAEGRHACPLPDVVAIGMQEMDMTAKAMLKEKTNKMKRWGSRLNEAFAAFPGGYRLVSCRQLMGIGLYMFASESVERGMSRVETSDARTGFFNSFGNKGAICARFLLEGKSFCFINCHLAAHQENTERRNKDHDRIIDIAAFDRAPQRLLSHDSVFWFGDLNYRLDLPRNGVIDSLAVSCKKNLMARHDQLQAEMRTGRVFRGFAEPLITWAPTYKLKRGEERAYSDKRSPAYCDRILYATSAAQSDADVEEPEAAAAAASSFGATPAGRRRSLSVGSDSPPAAADIQALDLFECVVCDRRSVDGTARRSGWKCKPCVGKRSAKSRGPAAAPPPVAAASAAASGPRRGDGSHAGAPSVMSCPVFDPSSPLVGLAQDAHRRPAAATPTARPGAAPFGAHSHPARPAVRCLAYTDDPSVTASDHRPVHGVYAVAAVFR